MILRGCFLTAFIGRIFLVLRGLLGCSSSLSLHSPPFLGLRPGEGNSNASGWASIDRSVVEGRGPLRKSLHNEEEDDLSNAEVDDWDRVRRGACEGTGRRSACGARRASDMDSCSTGSAVIGEDEEEAARSCASASFCRSLAVKLLPRCKRLGRDCRTFRKEPCRRRGGGGRDWGEAGVKVIAAGSVDVEGDVIVSADPRSGMAESVPSARLWIVTEETKVVAHKKQNGRACPDPYPALRYSATTSRG